MIIVMREFMILSTENSFQIFRSYIIRDLQNIWETANEALWKTNDLVVDVK